MITFQYNVCLLVLIFILSSYFLIQFVSNDSKCISTACGTNKSYAWGLRLKAEGLFKASKYYLALAWHISYYHK